MSLRSNALYSAIGFVDHDHRRATLEGSTGNSWESESGSVLGVHTESVDCTLSVRAQRQTHRVDEKGNIRSGWWVTLLWVVLVLACGWVLGMASISAVGPGRHTIAAARMIEFSRASAASSREPPDFEALSLSCPAGSFCAPQPCPIGSFCPPDSSAPTLCTSGSYCPTAGLTQAVSCPGGYYCAAAQSQPTVCPVGTYCPASSVSPTSCRLDQYCEQTGLIAPVDIVLACSNQCNLDGSPVLAITSATFIPTTSSLLCCSPLRNASQLILSLDALPSVLISHSWYSSGVASARGHLRVQLEPGVYQVTSGFNLTQIHSGYSAQQQLIIEARVPNTVTLSGAVEVPVVITTDPVQTISLPAGLRPFETLYINGVRQVRARMPNAGDFFYVQQQVYQFNGSTTYFGQPVAAVGFIGDTSAVNVLTTLSQTALARVELVMLSSWTESHMRVRAVSAGQDSIMTTTAWGTYRYGKRYFVENVEAALDAPGEWFYNPDTQQLKFIADADSSCVAGYTASVKIPQVQSILRLTGTSTSPVQFITIQNLAVAYASYTIPASGFPANQAALLSTGAIPDGAIQMTWCSQVTITGGSVRGSGHYGIQLSTGVRFSTVSNMEVYDTGAGGILSGLTSSDVTNHDNIFTQNRIHSTGHRFPGGVGLIVLNSFNNTLSKNYISDTSYSGISVGWRWDYLTITSGNNSIAQNFLTRIMLGAMNDGGAIYTLGRQPNTTIVGNVINGVRAYQADGAAARGLYFDQGSANMTVICNLVTGLDSTGTSLFAHQNTALEIRENLLVGAQSGIEFAAEQLSNDPTARIYAHENFLFPTGFTPSYIQFTGGLPLYLIANDNQVSSQLVTGNKTLATMAGFTPTNAYSVDLLAGLVDTLQVPILYQIDNTTFSQTPYTFSQPLASAMDGVLLTAIRSPSYLWTPVKPIPPTTYSIRARDLPLGTQPPNWSVVPAQGVISAQVGSDLCFLVNKSAPGVVQTWEPFTYITVNHRSGVTTETYLVKLSDTASLQTEWRDYTYLAPGKTYSTALLFSLAGNAQRNVTLLISSTTVVTNLPLDTMMRITVAGQIQQGATWNLTISRADNAVLLFHRSNISAYSPVFQQLDQIYFIGQNADLSRSCVDDIHIQNEPITATVAA